LTSLLKSRVIAKRLKEWILHEGFLLTEKVADLPAHNKVNTLEIRSSSV